MGNELGGLTEVISKQTVRGLGRFLPAAYSKTQGRREKLRKALGGKKEPGRDGLGIVL